MVLSAKNKEWYRCRVEAVLSAKAPGELGVTVHYVDYGRTETVPYTSLWKMKETFMDLPAQVRRTSWTRQHRSGLHGPASIGQEVFMDLPAQVRRYPLA